MDKNNLNNFEKFNLTSKNDNIFEENPPNVLTPQESDCLYNLAMDLPFAESLKCLKTIKLNCKMLLEHNPHHENAQNLITKIDAILQDYNLKSIVIFKNSNNKNYNDFLNICNDIKANFNNIK